PLNKRPVLCTLSNEIMPGLRDGVCEFVFYDLFYAHGRGTFLDTSQAKFQWFLNYTRTKRAGSTEYGIAVEHSKVLDAYNDLGTTSGTAAVQIFWRTKIRHYGLFKFPVHDSKVPSEETTNNYELLLKRLRRLQEVNRAGAKDQPGYLVLGIGLYAPRTGKVHDYLKDLLR
ncbi:unnamed protein product, partial [Ixodes pacificus]